MNIALIIPTGIGGHAGDANPVAKLMGACCDNLILLSFLRERRYLCCHNSLDIWTSACPSVSANSGDETMKSLPGACVSRSSNIGAWKLSSCMPDSTPKTILHRKHLWRACSVSFERGRSTSAAPRKTCWPIRKVNSSPRFTQNQSTGSLAWRESTRLNGRSQPSPWGKPLGTIFAPGDTLSPPMIGSSFRHSPTVISEV